MSVSEQKVLDYNIYFVGGPGTGKTCFLNRHKTGQFEFKYVPTLSLNSQLLRFKTRVGPIVNNVGVDSPLAVDYVVNLTIWDVPSFNDHKKLPACDGIVAFYTSHCTERTDELLDDYLSSHPEIPIVTVWNQCETLVESKYFKKKSKSEEGCKFLTKGRKTYQISGKSNYNFEKPFMYLMRTLSGHENMYFIEK
jgi:GTP-binding nuclear protein Ran